VRKTRGSLVAGLSHRVRPEPAIGPAKGPDPVGRPDDKLREIPVRPSGMSLRSIRLGTTTTFAALTCFGAAGQSAISRRLRAHGPPDCGRACICAPPAQLSRKARADFDEV